MSLFPTNRSDCESHRKAQKRLMFLILISIAALSVIIGVVILISFWLYLGDIKVSVTVYNGTLYLMKPTTDTTFNTIAQVNISVSCKNLLKCEQVSAGIVYRDELITTRTFVNSDAPSLPYLVGVNRSLNEPVAGLLRGDLSTQRVIVLVRITGSVVARSGMIANRHNFVTSCASQITFYDGNRSLDSCLGYRMVFQPCFTDHHG